MNYYIEVTQKPLDGWWIYLLRGTSQSAETFKSLGPFKARPTKAKLMQLQDRFCEGRKTQVIYY